MAKMAGTIIANGHIKDHNSRPDFTLKIWLDSSRFMHHAPLEYTAGKALSLLPRDPGIHPRYVYVLIQCTCSTK
jgi:hypothetical protein